MIEEGERAPRFELPAVVDGAIDQVPLDEHLGDGILILAFYPGDFNPACSGDSTDLDELDLFTMQKDVTILAISADSVYSHRAFADEYDLQVPLLADVYGEVIEKYGVAVADRGAGYRTRRAVVVIDLNGTVEYTWVADDIDALPDVGAIRDAVEGVGGDETARARYRVGHARYIEGRRAFTSAMNGFEDRDWMLAQSDFQRSYNEFADAADEFNTAVRFAEDSEAGKYYERAEHKAEALWQAAEWLAESASAFASGEGAEGESMRADAERPLETARDIHEPPDPDNFPPDEDPAEADDTDDETSLLPGDDDGEAASLDADIDADAALAEAEVPADTQDPTAAPAPEEMAKDETDDPAQRGVDNGEEAEADAIDDAELKEIAAELEEQTAAAKARQEETAEPGDDDTVADFSAADTATTAGDSDSTGNAESDGDVELDLADPTEDDENDGDDSDTDAANEETKQATVDTGDSGDHGRSDST